MWWYFLLITISSCSADQCQACFNSRCYERLSIFDAGFTFYGQIAVDYISNTVYFHLENQKNESFNLIMNINEAEAFSVIKDLTYQPTFARAVDQNTRDLYLGTSKGIYKYDPTSKSATYFALYNETVWHMQVHNGKLYYVLFDGEDGPKEGMYVFDNGFSNAVEALKNYAISDFVIDKNYDVYFISNYMLFRLMNGYSSPRAVDGDLYSLMSDIYRNVYLIQPAYRILYKMNYTIDGCNEIGLFPWPGKPFRVVLDSNGNVVYYDGELKRMFLLKQTGGNCQISRNYTHGISFTETSS